MPNYRFQIRVVAADEMSCPVVDNARTFTAAVKKYRAQRDLHHVAEKRLGIFDQKASRFVIGYSPRVFGRVANTFDARRELRS